MSSFFLKILLIIIIGMSALGAGLLASAQTVDQLKSEISAKTDEIKKLKEEIEKYEGDLVVLNKKKMTLANSIAQLKLLQKKLETEIRITQAKVNASDLKIRKLGSQISHKEEEIDSRTAAIKEALRGIYERDGYSLPQIAFSNESFSSVWDDLVTLDQFAGAVKENIDGLQELKSDLERNKVDREGEKKRQLNLKAELTDRKKIAEAARKEQSKLLIQTNNQETVFQRLLKGKIALKKAFERELDDAESRLQFLLDPNSIPPRGTKVFSSPLDSIYITQNFGKTSASGRLYASGTHNGTDFRARTALQVKAMADGVVAGVGDTDVTCRGASFGKWVLIRYKNGLAATFAHLSLIKVSAGDSVSANSVIGYSGNTGYSTGPHLHLSVYANAGVNIKTLPSKSCGGRTYTLPLAAFSAYLDPMDYL